MTHLKVLDLSGTLFVTGEVFSYTLSQTEISKELCKQPVVHYASHLYMTLLKERLKKLKIFLKYFGRSFKKVNHS